MSGAPCFRDLPEPYFTQSLSHLNEIQNAPNRHRLFEALDLGLNFLRELSARGLISPEDSVDAGRLWGDSADKRLRALPELGSAAPIHPSQKVRILIRLWIWPPGRRWNICWHWLSGTPRNRARWQIFFWLGGTRPRTAVLTSLTFMV